MGISIQQVSKRFREFSALKDVSLSIADGELIALLGPSGSGKTTLLRMIAGLEKPDKGVIQIASKANVSARSAVGFVFQHYALFKHMSVFENVAFGLRVRKGAHKLSEEVIHEKVMKLLNLVHLESYHARYPSQLSGGQRQRVALARALAVEPKILLLDEPFGALDAKVRKELRRWMRRLHEELNITTIFVTHDQEEAMEMADRVVVMSQGKIEQVGTPEQVYLQPANGFVYDFLGHYNEFDAWQLPDGTLLLQEGEKQEPVRLLSEKSNDWVKKIPLLSRLLRAEQPKIPVSQTKSVASNTVGVPVKVFCRPHELYFYITREPGTVKAEIIHMNPAGPLVKIELERENGALLDAELPKTVVDQLHLMKHQAVYVMPKNMKVFA
ncbi:MAG: TOBE-like domain-containing protein [Alphaproteobacteria bacterium]|nr:TOBE-like domain-containing protein [Alphaproteobacteria bacterium]